MLERNLRLLDLGHREQPNDPILAFNLAWALHKVGRSAEALPLLEQCRDQLQPDVSIVPKVYRLLGQIHQQAGRLEPAGLLMKCRDQLQPDVSIVPKVYRLLGQIHQQAGRLEPALGTFRAGRALFPNDVELLLHEGLLRRQMRDFGGAESCLRRILEQPATSCLVGLDLALRGYKTRHALAELYAEQRRHADAEAQWRLVVADQPGFVPAWLGLGELYLARRDWPALEQVIARLEAAGADARRLRDRMEQAARPAAAGQP
jgi:tetratricopeptide (TPR) repeat protein